MNAWNEHVTAALLGTERRQVPVLAGAPDVPAEAAGRLLDQAAVLAVRRRAGWVPGTAEPVAPAPVETAPAVSPDAARRLVRILGGQQIRLLPEWLETVAERGRRVPARLLPDLLEKGRADRSLRPSIAKAAGRRGIWLALQNTDWAYLVGAGDDPGDDPRVWETGGLGQRVAYLTRLRGTDPAAARAALAGTWAREPAPDRVALLGTFAHGLSLDDEGFLEAALDDRGKDVRQLAADLLARLPGSAYGRRLAERALACLRAEQFKVRGRRQTWIVVTLPREHDEDMARDGIPFHPPGSFAPGAHSAGPVGARVGWLREILARTPLTVWTELFELPPMEIVCLPVADDHAKDTHIGWVRAAAAQHDATWARALLKGGVVVDEAESLADLLAVLPTAERDTAAAELIRWAEDDLDLLRLLKRIPGPWTGDLAAAVLAAVAAKAEPSGGTAPGLAQLCALAGQHLDPAVAARASALAERHPDSRPLAGLLETLHFRHEMLEELH